MDPVLCTRGALAAAVAMAFAGAAVKTSTAATTSV